MSSAPLINRELAECFLRTLAPGTDRFTFQSFTDCPNKREEYKAKGVRDPLARILHGSLDAYWNTLIVLSAAGAGIFLVINETDLRGRATANIVGVRAYFVDLDGSYLANLGRLGLLPHLVTQSSPGRYHAYWLVVGATPEEFRSTQQRLAKLMDGDPTVCDLPRVMRLAGFPHQKNPAQPFLVNFCPYRSGPPYNDADFQAALTTAEAANSQKSDRKTRTRGDNSSSSTSSAPDMQQGYPDGKRTRELLRRAGWCLGRANMSEDETLTACLAWNRYNDLPLPEEKVRSTVASIAKAEAKKREDDAKRDPTQRDKLILIGLNADLWHDDDGNTYATVNVNEHQENFATNSRAFSRWLTHEYGERHPMTVRGKVCPSAPSTQALTEAINALTAKAARGAKHQAAIRVAGDNGSIYLDLGTPDWSAVEISREGWQIVATPPVRFIRLHGLRSLPIPVKGGHIQELSRFLNVASPKDFVLTVSWLLAALRPNGPYPVLIINGEQGSGKTLLCRILRRPIDPNGAELRNDTRDERDLLLAAKNGWIVALDNLSYVRNDLSDAICRIATKGAFATRALYTNDEEFLLEVCRPVLLNGIPPLASRADLTDRAIICVLPTMDDAKRAPEEIFWNDFDNAAPRILGALLDGVSGALRGYQTIKLESSCRMMDFAKWGEAGFRAWGAPAGTAERAYRHNRATANDDALDADPVAGALILLISKTEPFVGSASQLLSALELWTLPSQRGRAWPKDATRLSGHLRRLAPLLRPRGISIDFDHRSPDAARDRLIEIKRVAPK
jgi:RepB DNA-primase N-terminal domain